MMQISNGEIPSCTTNLGVLIHDFYDLEQHYISELAYEKSEQVN